MSDQNPVQQVCPCMPVCVVHDADAGLTTILIFFCESDSDKELRRSLMQAVSAFKRSHIVKTDAMTA